MHPPPPATNGNPTTTTTAKPPEHQFKVPFTRSKVLSNGGGKYLSGNRPGGLKALFGKMADGAEVVAVYANGRQSSPVLLAKQPLGRPVPGAPPTRTLAERKAEAANARRLPDCRPSTSKGLSTSSSSSTSRRRTTHYTNEEEEENDDDDNEEEKEDDGDSPSQEKLDCIARTILEGRQLRKRPVLPTEAPLRAPTEATTSSVSKSKKEARIQAQIAAKEKAAARERQARERAAAALEKEKAKKNSNNKKGKKGKTAVKEELPTSVQHKKSQQPAQQQMGATYDDQKALPRGKSHTTAREIYLQVQRDNAKAYFQGLETAPDEPLPSAKTVAEEKASSSATTSKEEEHLPFQPPPSFTTKLVSVNKSPYHENCFAVRFNQWIGKEPFSIFAVAGENKVSVYRVLDDQETEHRVHRPPQHDLTLREKLKMRQDAKLGYEALFTFQDDVTERFFAVNFTHNRFTKTGHPEHYILAGGQKGILRVFHCLAPDKGGDGLKGHGEAINDIAVDPKAPELVFTASSDWTVRMWNLLSMRTVAVFGGWMGHCDGVLSLDVHARLKIVASSGVDKQIMLWRYDTEDMERALARSVQRPVEGDPPTKFWPPVIQVPNYETHHPHSHYVDCVRFFGDYLITRSCDQTMKMWRVANEDGEPIDLLDATRKFIIRQPNRNENYKTRSNISLVHAFDFETTDMFFVKFGLCVEGKMMAVGDDDGDAWLWDLGGRGPQAIVGEVLPAPAVAAGPRYGGTVRRPVRECAINRQGTALVTVMEGGFIQLYSIGKAHGPEAPPHPALAAAFEEQQRKDAEEEAATAEAKAAERAAEAARMASNVAMMKYALSNAPGTPALFREQDRLEEEEAARKAAEEKAAAKAAAKAKKAKRSKKSAKSAKSATKLAVSSLALASVSASTSNDDQSEGSAVLRQSEKEDNKVDTADSASEEKTTTTTNTTTSGSSAAESTAEKSSGESEMAMSQSSSAENVQDEPMEQS